MQNILLTVKEKLPKLPKSERKIAKIILAHPLDIIQMSAADLAKMAESSPAAVIRFCRSIGVKGYTELKLQLSAVSNEIEAASYTDISPDENLDEIKKKMLWNTNYMLERTNNTLVNDALEQAVLLMVKSPVIYAYGLGASFLVAMDLKQKLTRIGKQVICTQDQHELVAALAIAPKDAVYFGISNSGEKREGQVLMEIAKKTGAYTISLTKDSDNSLSRLADIALKMADTNEAPLRSGATISLLTQMYAIDILFYHFMTKKYEDNIEYLELSRKAIANFSNIMEMDNN
ncbi:MULTISPECIES: MurR/RpiR family transcriptional regulator [unclassified Jeotgalibaca]|uniref:MurR/RpiR family transcriptional regulator n=1 Tax=unclassified Jeotgalibaca TaxID=2621505 RepID=UPI003FD300A4